MKDQLIKAHILAHQIHSGQYRKKNKDPYVIHLIRIYEHLSEKLKDINTLDHLKIVALLHDSIEDTWVTKQYIEKNFSKQIANDVFSLSIDKTKSLKDYLIKLENASDEAKIIKLFDLYDNTTYFPIIKPKHLEILKKLKISNPKYKKVADELTKRIQKNLTNL